MSQHLISTTVKPTTCPGCGAAVLRAVAEGQTVTVNVEPIEPAAETTALLTGALTFSLGTDKELTYRDAGRIRSGHLRGTIHVQHPCRQASLK